MSKKDHLEKCPVCRGKAKMMHCHTLYWVECKACMFSVGESEDQEEAAKIWNDYAVADMED